MEPNILIMIADDATYLDLSLYGTGRRMAIRRTGKNWVLWHEISRIPMIVWHPSLVTVRDPCICAIRLIIFRTVLEAWGWRCLKGEFAWAEFDSVSAG